MLIARFLLSSHSLLLMDEPLSAVDINRRKGVLDELIKNVTDLKKVILVISHNHDANLKLQKVSAFEGFNNQQIKVDKIN